MNKSAVALIIGALSISITSLYACPIRIQNDTNVPIYVVTTPIANKLTDIATAAQIKEIVQSQGLKSSEYEKIRSGQTETVGTEHTNTYHVYVRAEYAQDPEDKNYIRMYQLQLTACIPHEQQKQWWQANTVKMSQLKSNKLTPAQKRHLSLQSVGGIFGYSVTPEYKQLHDKLLGLWKIIHTPEPATVNYYQESREKKLDSSNTNILHKKHIEKEAIILEEIEDYT